MAALDGLRILDLSRLLPGPYCTLLLADLGADVVKVEDPAGGDYLRHSPPIAGETSALFHALNRNKRSVALDLKSEKGRSALLRLAGRFDVVVESFRPGVMDRLGVGWAALSQGNPRVILCSISGFGASGPLAARAGHDLGYVARSGVLGFGGEPGGPPAMPGVQIADIGGAYAAALAILAADRERGSTGRGRHLDISLCESSASFLHMHLGGRLAMGERGESLARGREALNGGLPCYGVYRTRDSRYLALAALEPRFWGAFCAAVGREDLEAAGWATGDEGERVKAAISALVAARSLAEWEAFLADKDLCCEPVREGDEVLAEEALAARGAFGEVADPREGRAVGHLRTPLHLSDPPLRPAPGLGEHTRQVLLEAGFSEDEAEELERAGRPA